MTFPNPFSTGAGRPPANVPVITPARDDSLTERLRAAGIITQESTIVEPWDEVVLPLAILQFDGGYQRKLRPDHLRHIIENWDPIKNDPVLVNWRLDDSFFCMDGQHRTVGMLEKFGITTHAKVRLFYGLTYEQEAAIFNSQDYRKALSHVESFRGGINAKEQPYVDINAIVERCGWRVAKYQGDNYHGSIQAVGTLIRMHHKFRSGTLAKTLELIKDCFGTELSPNGGLLLGFGQFITWYEAHPNFKREALVKRMRDIGFSRFYSEYGTRMRMERVSGQVAVGMTLVTMYNLGRRPDKRLTAWDTMLTSRKLGGGTRAEWSPEGRPVEEEGA